jgi:hypothetical protein
MFLDTSEPKEFFIATLYGTKLPEMWQFFRKPKPKID